MSTVDSNGSLHDTSLKKNPVTIQNKENKLRWNTVGANTKQTNKQIKYLHTVNTQSYNYLAYVNKISDYRVLCLLSTTARKVLWVTTFSCTRPVLSVAEDRKLKQNPN